MHFDPPFTDGAGMVRFIHGTLERKKDLMLCNHGPEGSGKSTTGINMAKAINPGFDPRNDLIKDLDHLLQVLHECKLHQVYLLDESVNIFHNQDWATWEAKDLSKIIRQMRIMRSVWILNQPDFEGLHPYVREARIPLRVYHPPVFDQDGMGNGPAQVFWKHEWFSYKEQRVVRRWNCVIEELWVDNLDATPEWQGYEEDKVQNFKHLVEGMMKRRAAEQAKKTKGKKQGKKKAGKSKSDDSLPSIEDRGAPQNGVVVPS